MPNVVFLAKLSMAQCFITQIFYIKGMKIMKQEQNSYISESKTLNGIGILRPTAGIDEAFETYLVDEIKQLNSWIENSKYSLSIELSIYRRSRLEKMIRNKTSLIKFYESLLKKGSVDVSVATRRDNHLSGVYTLHKSGSIINIRTNRIFNLVGFIDIISSLESQCAQFEFVVNKSEVDRLSEQDLMEGLVVTHFKGSIYQIICVATGTENSAKYVIYKSSGGINPPKIYARPLDMFLEEVEYDGKIVPRFSK